jgi:hypothetical protein
MGDAAVPRALLGRPMLASLAAHGLAALLIPALVWTASESAPVETISFVHVARIQVLRPPQRLPQPRAIAPQRSPVRAIDLATRMELARTQPHRPSSPPPERASKTSSAPNLSTVARTGDGVADNAAPAPQTTATPQARLVSSTVGRDTGGYMPFGAQEPVPVLDPATRGQLASLGVHLTLIVTVSEDGHTKNVVFDPPVDSQLESRIQSLLADASWDPAVCGGGISCEGRATIRL